LRVPPAPLKEYAHIKRFYDPRLGAVSAKILPGEYYVTNADEVITTLLGSCVTACIWDPEAGIGGMNHFMNPGAGSGASGGARYGLFAMEFLINSILTHGGQRHRLVAKLTGGGKVVQGSASIGSENVRFARTYLSDEGIELISEHVEGNNARRVAFHPLSGRCRIQELATWTAEVSEVSESERKYATAAERPTDGPGDIELF
jgi:chemotaxis protein CheD